MNFRKEIPKKDGWYFALDEGFPIPRIVFFQTLFGGGRVFHFGSETQISPYGNNTPWRFGNKIDMPEGNEIER